MKTKSRITEDTIICRNQDQLFSEIDGEIVMLNVTRGEYLNLDEIGSQIWNELQEPCTFETLIQRLLLTYEVEKDVCTIETKAFLDDLIQNGIVKILHE